ncbi:MAG: 3-dehydroquinate synthase [bacterium]|nr:3-dehydroquinate synthase [bacterium]
MEKATVDLGKRSYDILIENGILDQAGTLIKSLPLRQHTTIITNDTIAPLYLEQLKTSLTSASITFNEIILPDGEEHKELKTIEAIHHKLLTHDLDRNSPLIALGGGVIGDMTGFAAATYLRGVPFIQIPTTLLSQVDSSVGGKTGVNLPGGKNMVGAFYQPALVIIDPLVLKTLERRELKAGMAEVIKYGIIWDASFFNFLKENLTQAYALDAKTIARLIKTCCTIKAEITSRDETEKGIRSYLNFGHTIGHAIETLTEYKTYIHGEAVAIGMVAAAKLSAGWGHCDDTEVSEVVEILQQAELPTKLPSFSAEEYSGIIQKDKKKTGSSVRMVLMNRIGKVLLKDIDQPTLIAALKKMLTA